MNSQYLSALYNDFETKVESIHTYIKKSEDRTNEINKTAHVWLGKLKEKYEMLERFRKTRQHALPSNQFSLEVTPPADPADNSDIKNVDKEINDLSAQLNYLFQKSENETDFLVQSLFGANNSLQEIVNGIYEQFQDLYDKM